MISRTRLEEKLLKLKLWHITSVYITTLCTDFEQNRLTFISESAPVSQAEALKRNCTDRGVYADA